MSPQQENSAKREATATKGVAVSDNEREKGIAMASAEHQGWNDDPGKIDGMKIEVLAYTAEPANAVRVAIETPAGAVFDLELSGDEALRLIGAVSGALVAAHHDDPNTADEFLADVAYAPIGSYAGRSL